MNNEKSQRCRVFPRGSNWVVQVDKVEDSASVHESRRDAIEAAKELARRHVCEVVIHSSDPKNLKKKIGEPAAVQDNTKDEVASEPQEAMPEGYLLVTVSEKMEVVIPEAMLSPLSLYPGARLQVLRFEDRLELIPEKRVKEMRGFLKGIDTVVQRGGGRP